jgi:hypothetical protein
MEQKRGMVAVARGIVVEEGVASLFSGLTPAVLRHVVYSGHLDPFCASDHSL